MPVTPPPEWPITARNTPGREPVRYHDMAPPWLNPSNTTFEVSMHSSLSTCLSTASAYARSEVADQRPPMAARVTKMVESLDRLQSPKLSLPFSEMLPLAPCKPMWSG